MTFFALAHSAQALPKLVAPLRSPSALRLLSTSTSWQCACSPPRLAQSRIPSPRPSPRSSPPAFFTSAPRANFPNLRSGRGILSSTGFFITARHLPPSQAIFFTSSRNLSTVAATTAPSPDPPEILLTTPDVAKYLVAIAAMVFTIVVVGGMTRLTESGLSITEWNLVTGVLPPLGLRDWEREFEKYRATPEWKLQNQHITLSEFKTIYLWEWSHRLLGRVIGVAFLAPIPYFFLRRRLSRQSAASLLGIGTLIGGQGALGWYMVKSGLDEHSVKELGGVARVSQYRLAAHLGMAFLVYAGLVRLAISVGRDWKIVNGAGGLGAGLGGSKTVEQSLAALNNKVAGRVRVLVTALTALIFITGLSGAFVAGLDAGLIYNEFPYMGEGFVPPTPELMSDQYARKADKSDKWWRNMLENPVTAQFDHRVLATTAFASIVSLFFYVRRPSVKPHLPPATFRLIKGTMHMSVVQVLLGISTLIYLVPTHLAATHQAGSLVLLTIAVAAGASLRRPGKVATELMKLRRTKV